MFFASLDDPPFLIMHGDHDKTVSIKQSEELKSALLKAGVSTQFLIVKDGQHDFFAPDTIGSVVQFFDANLKAKQKL